MQRTAKLCEAMVLESVAFTQQPGSDSAAPVRWHITAATASFALALSFRPALCSLSKKIVGYKVLLCRFRKKIILLWLIIYTSIKCRGRGSYHICASGFSTKLASRWYLRNLLQTAGTVLVSPAMLVVSLFQGIITTRPHQLVCFTIRYSVTLMSVSVCVFLTHGALFWRFATSFRPPADLWLLWHPWMIPINGDVLGGRSNYFSGATAPVISRVTSPGLYFL